VVNNVVVNRTTVVNVENINVYRNAGVRNGMVVVKEDRFGHGPITSARITQVEAQHFRPTHEGPKVATAPASFVPSAYRGVRPPEASLRRPVVATRAPHAAPGEGAAREPNQGPAPRLVSPPQSREAAATLPRPAFGQSKFERSTADRAKSPAPPKPDLSTRPKGEAAAPSVGRPVQGQRQPQVAAPPPTAPQQARQRLESPRETSPRSLPGEPANRLSPSRGEVKPPQSSERKPPAAGRLPQSPEGVQQRQQQTEQQMQQQHQPQVQQPKGQQQKEQQQRQPKVQQPQKEPQP
jgi:hypothetical protein